MAYPKQVVSLPSGKGLGGTSNVNSMIYTRGSPYDYDRLGELGINGWSYSDVLEVFKRMENYTVPHRREDHEFHGFDGLQTVSTPLFRTPMADAFLQAGNELGYYQVDCNAKYQIGFTRPPVNIKDGVRWGSYRAYLETARKNRANLHVITDAIVTKIRFDRTKKATGVEFKKGDYKCSLSVRKEVIVSAGALRSPQLLMVSGVGPRKQLDDFKIPVVHELPGVGQNLKDHVLVMGINFNLNQNVSINFTRLNTSRNYKLWQQTRTGLGPMTSSNGVEGISFFRSTSEKLKNHPQHHPAFEISFFSDKGVSSDFFAPEFRNSFIFENGKDAVSLIPILLQTQSVGQVRLRSADATENPIVDPKYLSNTADVDLLLEVLKIALTIGKSNAFQKFGAQLIKFGSIPGCDGLLSDSDEFWRCFIRRFSCAGYHFTGTCKMSASNDSMGVVDSRLKVRGLHGLRVADASVMPESPAGHTHAVALLVGERVAEFIKQDYGWNHQQTLKFKLN
uniref:Glucose-methanol-choline oxidoreductase N-terminal domain-containing protein n=1 Tax=Strigamia maritima TaxID=126957 RepID=T1J7Q4_STRMM